MTTYRKPSRLNRILAVSLAVFVGLGPIATPSYAALTALADEPINVKNSSKPNIVMTIDDSTSMFYDFLPDYVVGTVTYVKNPDGTFSKTVTDAFCRGANGAMGTACGYNDFPTNSGDGGQYVSPQYIWEQPSYPYPKYDKGSTADIKAPFAAPFTFSKSGPGAGCNTDSAPPSCSSGVDPGALPGITNYPMSPGAAGASPMAGQPYEYWLLWPAPAHNAALNHLYYNPLLTYETPARPDGTAYPQMDSSYTTGWTRVPPNPFADPGNVLSCLVDGTCVDLTAKVIVGQWCDSDWTQGKDDAGTPFVTNPGFCRANGLVAAASGGAPAADGDYSYPWAPPGIKPNDVLSKVDWSTVSINPPANATVLPAWTTAQDPKNFYENDTVLWCDVTSPDWPQTGPTLPQTCQGLTAQTCDANSVPVCAGGVAGTCTGNKAAGTCNNQTKGTCSGGATSGACSGVTGACTGYVAGACGGGVTGSCSNKPTCTGFTAKSCSGLATEACTGATGACGVAPGQTCTGGTHTACAPTGTSFTCNGYQGPQTCDNHTPAPVCANQWDPPGCNTDPNPEGTCVYHPVCNTPAAVYTCSIKGNSCLAANGTSGDASKCPVVYGSCSGGTNSGGSCSSNANCPGTVNKCSVGGAACSTNNDCPFNANSGTCNITSTACTPGGAACPAGPKKCVAGQPSTTTCNVPADCNVSGHCAVTTGTTCTSSATCPTVPLSGACNYQNNGGVTNGACTSAADCKDRPNVCNNPAGLACATVAACTQGTCNTQNAGGGSACAVNTDCINTGNHCTAGLGTGVACTTAPQCNKLGTCSAGSSPTGTCTTAANCNVAGICATTGIACTTGSATDPTCKKAGTCDNGAAGPCYTSGPNDANCAKPGTCSNTGAACNGLAGQCGAVAGTCSIGTSPTGTCLAGSDCNVSSKCSASRDNGTACVTAATCRPTSVCSVDKTSCTTAATCAQIGHCSIDTGLSCTAANASAVCLSKPGPLNPSLARCDTSGVSGSALTTLLADSNGPGKTCRRNNHLYADGVTAARFNYPSGNFTTPISGEAVAGLGCHKTDQYTSLPRHYWKTSVEWCDKNINTAGDKWLGYGTPMGGSCQAFKDSTHAYPRFYQ
ncbi:MAG: hypothetical protein ABI440_05295, partial [Casimicrobiaceae bacterium]